MTEPRIRAAVVREGTEEERAETAAAFPAESLPTPTTTGTTHSINKEAVKTLHGRRVADISVQAWVT